MRTTRFAGGYLDQPKLLLKLRGTFSFRALPDFAQDLRSVARTTELNLELVPDSLGGRLSFLRSADRKRIHAAFEKTKTLAVVGASGSGKSTLVRSWAEASRQKGAGLIWVSLRQVEKRQQSDWAQELGLKRTEQEIFGRWPHPRGLLVFDGADLAFADTTFVYMARLMRACAMEDSESPWQVVITCQTEAWERVRSRLQRADTSNNALIEVVQLGGLDLEDLMMAHAAFPQLGQLTIRPHLGEFLRRPKFLELLVAQPKAVSGAGDWVGESDLIKWWWETVVCEGQLGSSREAVVRAIGSKTADGFTPAVPLDEVADGDAIPQLVNARVLSYDEGRVGFAHDLFMDWTRQRQVLAHQSDLLNFARERVGRATWHKAIRLFGLHLLEQSPDTARWKAALEVFGNEKDSQAQLARDLLLESVIFAGNAVTLLEKVWANLAENQGALLQRLLGRFQHVATIPHPGWVQLYRTRAPDRELSAAARYRLPLLVYWLPAIKFLRTHLEEVIVIAPDSVAEICALWLASTAKGWPQRRAAAELALATARRAWRHENAEEYLVKWRAPKSVYRALLLAAAELPREVEELVLKLSGRSEINADDIAQPTPEQRAEILRRQAVAKANAKQIRAMGAPPISFLLPNTPVQPWLDGPKRHPTGDFPDVFFGDVAANEFLAACPASAAEATLALILETPLSRNSHDMRHGSFGDHGFQSIEDDSPSFYTRGPFLMFLRLHPNEALETIIRLVNYATDRIQESVDPEEFTWESVPVTMYSVEKKWRGIRQVYFWYRVPLMTAATVTSALMALEKWFYEKIDAGEPFEPWLEKIVSRTDSVAFAGLMIAIGKRYPNLFFGPLWPLVATFEFQLWEGQHIPMNEGVLGPGGSAFSPRDERIAMNEWHKMPQRTQLLSTICLEAMLRQPERRAQIDLYRLAWEQRAAASSTRPERVMGMRRSAARVDLSNWQEVPNKSGELEWRYSEPAELRDEEGKRPFQERATFSTVTDQVRKLLNSRKSIPRKVIEEAWTVLQDLHGYEATPPEDQIRADKCDALTGFAAVLIVLARDWLKEHKEARELCWKIIGDTVDTQPMRRGFGGHDPTDFRWDSFCAEALPTMWAENPADADTRRRVFALAVAPSEMTVTILHRAASEQRTKLGKAFDEMLCLQLHRAVLAPILHRAQFDPSFTFDAPAWLNRWEEKFVNGTMPELPEDWSSVTNPTAFPPVEKGTMRRSHRRFPDLDLDRMTAACSWAFPIGLNDSARLRAEKIHIHGQLLAGFLRTFPTSPAHEIEGTPYAVDRQLLKQVASVVLHMKPAEDPERLWRPILELGPKADNWVETFLTEIFLHGLADKNLVASLEALWRSLLDFAFESKVWNPEEKGGHFHLNDLWEHLLGIDSIVANNWEESHGPLLERMKPYYKRWAERFLTQERHLRCFIHFLERKVAATFLIEGLIWIAPLWQELKPSGYVHESDESTFAEFLLFLWEKQWEQIRRDAGALASFQSLASGLASLQNAIALEVLGRVAASQPGRSS